MIIGLVGQKSSGKSTLARMLVKHRGYRRVPFAGPLKAMLIAFLVAQGCSVTEATRYVDGDWKEVLNPYLNGRTTRYAMQTLGTEWGRELISPTLWVDSWCRSLDDRDTVVDDVRFANEVDAIRERGGVLVRVARPGQPAADDAHASETELRGLRVDFMIVNGGEKESMLALLDEGLR
jgi:hypothetical protein